MSLTWTMAPRDANVNTLSSKISGVQSKKRPKWRSYGSTLAYLPQKNEKLRDLVWLDQLNEGIKFGGSWLVEVSSFAIIPPLPPSPPKLW